MQSQFSVDVRTENQATVLVVTGELDLATSPELEQALEGPAATEAELVIVDLREVEFMDSTGLRVLVNGHERAMERGQRFGLVNGTDQVQRLLTLTGVVDLLNVASAPEELLGAG